jgi:cytosine/adenosine deaminase-related metal-dependent hydrolase
MANSNRAQFPKADPSFIIRARVLLPVVGPPIENGAVLVFRDRIAVAGPEKKLPAGLTSTVRQTLDLGDVILMPGLVNAHCHLDYTGMAGLWPPPKKFIDWIPRIIAAKAEWSYSDYARSWLQGAKMLLASGTTTVADIEAVPELLPDVWDATPLRIMSFLEMTSVRPRREPAEILNEALERIASLDNIRCSAALSPHAPYSTTAELLRLCARAAREKHLRVATHVAESDQEFDMFTYARGEMFDWLKRNERDNSDCGHGTPLHHLESAGLMANGSFIAIHANYLNEADFKMVAGRKLNVVHCPRSHEYFQHAKFPLDQLLTAKANVCLGTDSLATTAKKENEPLELNLFQEMQAFSRANPTVAPETILKMATINGARALGMAGKVGELSAHAFADMIAIPFTGPVADASAAVVNFSGHVHASMIGGQWAITPG